MAGYVSRTFKVFVDQSQSVSFRGRTDLPRSERVKKKSAEAPSRKEKDKTIQSDQGDIT